MPRSKTSPLNPRTPLPSASEMSFGLVVAEWNRDINEVLLEGAVRTLKAAGCPEYNIQIKYVPGTFELMLGAQFVAEYTDVDAIILLGCTIRDEAGYAATICQGVVQGAVQVQLQWNVPVLLGIIEVDDRTQALSFCGGSAGNQGEFVAAQAINMVKLQVDMEAASPNIISDRREVN
ncbi:MAG: 6,7-dimethyl-8-ribityllumazine synthase [Alistipes sp.]